MSEPFAINVADARAVRHEGSGTYVPFEDPNFVGAGTGPCWIRTVGARKPDKRPHYPVNERAARDGASAAEPTNDPRAAYADWSSDFEETKLPWPPA